MLYIANVFIRGLTLISKFALLFLLARYLDVDELGLYGLVAATITYSIYLLGLEFYTYSTRELIKSPLSKRWGLIKSQFCLYSITYPIIFSLISVIFWGGLLPWSLALLFYMILTLEHLSQEIYRILIATTQQLSATIAIFIRQGLWIWVSVFFLYAYPELRNLQFILCSWLCGSLFCLIYSMAKIRKVNKGSGDVCWSWVYRGVFSAMPFFISSIFVMAISTVDRYWFESLVNRDALGYYVFYSGLVSALVSFLDAAVFSFIYPKLVQHAGNSDNKSFSLLMKKMLRQTIYFAGLFILSAIYLIDFILMLVNRFDGNTYIYVFYFLLFSTILQALSYIPHYGLYARGFDKPIIFINIGGFFMFLIVAFAFLNVSETYAIPISLCITYSFILLAKTFFYYSLPMKNTCKDSMVKV
ncbi:hypothetical protein K3H35_15155 [Aeromonas veronii]|uniref:oligosaccharide flippase family protein n=1 Tax=Aeromonas veronii TaxID=654 RepID=UPI001F3723AD|nr:oligosaccharide flippase family protein [Aeromonas veronii]MCF5910119.1 hypothetical protein [Aeromonas veronii]